MKCMACGFENEDAQAVCAQCGAALPPSAVCRSCGKSVRADAKYCVYCGESLSAPQLPAEPAQPPLCEELPAPEPVPEPDEPSPEPAPEPVQKIVYVPQILRPAYQLPTRRGFWKMLLLGILTLLTYPIVIMSRISVEINMVASPRDGRRTVHFLFVPVLSAITLGIYGFVWMHELCARIGGELKRRGLAYVFGARAYWLWSVLYPIVGALVGAVAVALLSEQGTIAMTILAAAGVLSIVGPCIFLHKLMRAMNLMNADYNERG